MNILIVGCGKVGSRLAAVLYKQGYDVSVLSKSDEDFDLLPSDFIGFTTSGVPIDLDVLKKAAIESCDVVVAVTNDDNVNIMVGEIAKEIYKVAKVFVRINDPKCEEVFSSFGMSTICPTNLTVAAVCNALNDNIKTENVNFGTRTVAFAKMDIPKSFIGRNVSDIEYEEDEVLYAIERGTQLLLVGLSNYLLQKDDRLIFSKIID